MSQEGVIAILERAAQDDDLRQLLATASSTELEEHAAALGIRLRGRVDREQLTDADLDGMSPSMSDRTCYGTTDCCQTKRTCFGTTDCCR